MNFVQIDDLTASFGSKRKKQAMGSRLRNEIQGEALEKALSSAVVEVVSQNKNQQGNFRIYLILFISLCMFILNFISLEDYFV